MLQQPLPQQQQQQQQPSTPPLTTTPTTQIPTGEGEAPPKQVAMAMERLGQAGRLIADIRLGADRVLEALFVTDDSTSHNQQQQQHQSSKTLNLIAREDSCIKQHLLDLRTVGRELEGCGVISEALRSRSNSWGLHMPLVCPDGAVVAYAWKRQLAGQAGASAVDRTRLALKSFTDQRKRFFPHLDHETSSKKQCVSQDSLVENTEDHNDYGTLEDILKIIESEVSDMKLSTYERLEWSKRASALPTSSHEGSLDSPMDFHHGTSNLRHGAFDDVSSDRAAVIEVHIPSVFRALISLHPVGSKDPDAVAFFSPDEGGSYVHPRGVSVYHVFKHITELSNIALQYFLGNKPEMALYLLLRWISCYQSLFTQVCSKCGRLLSMDKQLALFLPPVNRPYRDFMVAKNTSTSPKDQSIKKVTAYHVSCSPPDV